MSYSMLEPDWPPVCECFYDEERDELYVEDCPLHRHLAELFKVEPEPSQRKPPASAGAKENESAA